MLENPDSPEPTISPAKLVDYWGGVAQLQRQMERNGWPIKAKTIQKWRERGSVPQHWLVRMALVARKKQRRFNLADFVEKGQEQSRDSALDDFLSLG
jgi:hypothetical protein